MRILLITLCFGLLAGCLKPPVKLPGSGDTRTVEERKAGRLAPGLTDPDSAKRGRAAYDLGELKAAAGDYTLQIAALLRDPEAVVRAYAADALGKIGPKARAAVPPLTSALKDPDEHVRGYAANALAAIGTPAIDSAPELLQTFSRDTNATVRGYAGNALGDILAASRTALPFLRSNLQNGDVKTRIAAAQAMNELETKAKVIVNGLTGGLKDRNAKVRSCAVMALGKAGGWGRSAMQQLNKVMKGDPDQLVRNYAADSLVKIDQSPD